MVAQDDELLKEIGRICKREISKYIRSQSKPRFTRYRDSGFINFIQRSSSDLALNYHFHFLVTEGEYVWHGKPNKVPKFLRIAEPSNQDVEKVLKRIRNRVVAHLINNSKYDVLTQPFAESFEEEELNSFGQIKVASVSRQIALGSRRGRPVRRIGASLGSTGEDVSFNSPRSARVNGFSLHANRLIEADNREDLSFMLRYLARGELSLDRLSEDENKDIILTLKRPFSDGTTAVKFSPMELIEKLAAIIPYPHKNLVIYSGCFASNSKIRPHIIPKKIEEGASLPIKRYIPWAMLLKRTIGEDLFICPHCRGSRRIVAVVTNPEVIWRILKRRHSPGADVESCENEYYDYSEELS